VWAIGTDFSFEIDGPSERPGGNNEPEDSALKHRRPLIWPAGGDEGGSNPSPRAHLDAAALPIAGVVDRGCQALMFDSTFDGFAAIRQNL
jgi:hypothetical protein